MRGHASPGGRKASFRLIVNAGSAEICVDPSILLIFRSVNPSILHFRRLSHLLYRLSRKLRIELAVVKLALK